jgi:hypothetical protein
MVMLGGIGRSAADDDLVALSTGSIWTDIQTNSSNGWQPGLFVGYTANMGAHEVVEVQPDLSRSEGKVASLYAFSPRLKYIIGKAWVGAEWLYSTAAWGSEFDGYGVPVDTEEYANHRFLLSLRYNF